MGLCWEAYWQDWPPFTEDGCWLLPLMNPAPATCCSLRLPSVAPAFIWDEADGGQSAWMGGWWLAQSPYAQPSPATPVRTPPNICSLIRETDKKPLVDDDRGTESLSPLHFDRLLPR
jgi:hypothetical protein